MVSQIKSSGTKQTIKVTTNVTQSMQSIRNVPISPMKGVLNPPHIHIKNPFKKGQ